MSEVLLKECLENLNKLNLLGEDASNYDKHSFDFSKLNCYLL